MSEAELKARIAKLEARLAALEPKPAPAPAKYQEPVATITTFVEHGEFVMPDERQSRQLLGIVQARYPALKLVGDITERDRETELQRFRAALFYLGHVDRRADGTLDTRAYPPWYCDEARIWLRAYGGKYGEDISVKTYLAAALGHGDIAIGSQDNFRNEYGFGIGIVPVGSGGRKCSNKWRTLLDGSARVREPVA